jgi:hypothetical protein
MNPKETLNQRGIDAVAVAVGDQEWVLMVIPTRFGAFNPNELLDKINKHLGEDYVGNPAIVEGQCITKVGSVADVTGFTEALLFVS